MEEARSRITDRAAVLRAIQEFDAIGRKEFLERYGFPRSRNYPIVWAGRYYDSPAIVAAAHRLQFPTETRLGPQDFADGFLAIRAELKELGFSLRSFDGTDHPAPHYWWRGRPEERYWVEVRGISRGLGTELRAGIRDSKFEINSWYELLAELKPGDIVFHWHRDSKAFVGASSVAARFQVDERVGDRTVALVGFTSFLHPVTRGELLSAEAELLSIRDQLAQEFGSALHLPFAFRSDGMRLMQNYFGKLPRSMALVLFERELPGLQLEMPDDVDEVEDFIDGVAGRSARGRRAARPYRLDARERRAIERRAMAAAEEWLTTNGWPAVEDKSATESYDLLASDGVRQIKIEVKGTTSAGASILLTKNERWLHAEVFPDNGLIVVRHILLELGEEPLATGGEVVALMPWQLDESRLTALAFAYDLGSPTT